MRRAATAMSLHDDAFHAAGDPGPLQHVPFTGIDYSLPDDDRILASSVVDSTWAGHQAGQALLTTDQRQFVAYYDADRRMTVAQRTLGSDEWIRQPVDSVIGWDSHNYVTLARDTAGHLHVSGNMHAVPLVYFRTTEPDDVTSLAPVPTMVNSDQEQRVTYPRFLRNPDDELIFRYRDGSSGNGADLYNIYDTETRQWTRLLDTPLHDGEGRRNAYVEGPVLGPDGYYHLAWVWRDTPDAATNQHLSYAKSRDLVHWVDSSGSAVTLPITYASGEVVDPVPVNGGIINGNTKIGFDGQGRVLLSYHKYDDNGETQVFLARRDRHQWKIRQVSNWTGRWTVAERGSLIFQIRLGAVSALPDGHLRLDFSCHDHQGTWILSSALRPIAEIATPMPPAELTEVRSTFPGLVVSLAEDSGDADGRRHLLRWENRPPHQDRPWDPPHPDPGPLEVYTLG